MTNAGVTNSYSTVAVVPEIGVSGRVVDGNAGVYTCPAGFKAKVTGSMVLDSLGSDASYAIAIIRADGNFTAVGGFVVVGETSMINNIVILNEGDILTMVGDSGSTNGSGDMDCVLQEIAE